MLKVYRVKYYVAIAVATCSVNIKPATAKGSSNATLAEVNMKENNMGKVLTVILSTILVASLMLLLGVTIRAAANGVWAIFVVDALCLLLATPASGIAIKNMIDLFW